MAPLLLAGMHREIDDYVKKLCEVHTSEDAATEDTRADGTPYSIASLRGLGGGLHTVGEGRQMDGRVFWY